jgi:TRAP-type C4-dicarboxylate transport system substrate-binding protein
MRRILLSCALALGAILGQPASAQETTLRAVSFVRLDDVWGKLFVEFVKQVNDNGKGLVQIRMMGGPEAINQFELGNAIKTGVVDIGMLPGGFYQSLFPAALSLSVSTKSPVEQRQNGAWEQLNKLHNTQVNAQFLANYGFGVPFHIYTTKPIDKADFTGLKLRTVPIYRPFFEKLGATTLQTQHAELYTALERGVVDGYGWSLWGLKEQGFLPVTKFRIEPGFYSGNVSILVNLPKWQSLRPDQQAFLTKTAIDFERNFAQTAERQRGEELQKQDSAGVKAIKLAPAEADRFVAAALEAGWADVRQKAPADYEQLRKLME